MNTIPNEISNTSINHNMPKYEHYPGACGLTSLLMVLKPQPRSIAPILDELWEKISNRYKISSNIEKSKNWQVVLEWLLFQTLINKPLQNQLAIVFGDIFFDSMLPILRYGIEEINPFSSRYGEKIEEIPFDINKDWLMRRVYIWKQNFELSILLNIFGFEFLPWKLNHDGTGALFFTSKELKKHDNIYKQKLKFLLDRIECEDPILCCESIHWIAIKNFQRNKDEYLVIYHDPATASENLRLLKYFRESDRFYVYRLNTQMFEYYQKILKTL